MNGSDRIALATSLPPQLVRHDGGAPASYDYQAVCLQSWARCGFRIVSVNTRDEIRVLQPKYPDVDFVEATIEPNAFSGKPNPPLSLLLAALSARPERIVGVANSDIVFEVTERWRAELPALTRNCVVTGQRLDVDSLTQGATSRLKFGFDYFFFERAAIAPLAGGSEPYALGLPWWDYWLPLALACRGAQLAVLAQPATFHLRHQTSWLPPAWRSLAFRLAQFLRDEARRSPEVTARLGDILAVCEQLERMDNAPPPQLDPVMSEFSQRCAAYIRGHAL